MGPTTRSAIRTYQADRGLPVTGEFSPGLLDDVRGTHAAATGRAAPADRFGGAALGAADLVADIQAELRRRGYGVSVVSGQMDQPTEAAIRAYQRDRGLTVTGEPSERLLEDLRPAGTQQAGIDRDAVREIQHQLQRRGYDIGVADGVLGPTTRNAIRTYQADAGLPVTGEPSASLLRSLGVEEGEDRAAAPDLAEQRPRDDQAAGWTWRVVFEDDFADADQTRDQGWTVHSGRFTVEDGALVSRVAPAREAEAVARTGDGAQRPGDLGQAILRGVLEQVIGGAQPTAGVHGAAEEEAAEISAAVRMTNAFRIRLDLSSHMDEGRFAFGPHQGGDRSAGYRLAYASGGDGDGPPSLELLGVSRQGGVRVIGSTRRMADLEADGGTHRIEWTRAADGQMAVAVDGTEIMAVSDRGFEDPFAGLTLTNAGGEYAIHRVTVEVPEPR